MSEWVIIFKLEKERTKEAALLMGSEGAHASCMIERVGLIDHNDPRQRKGCARARYIFIYI